MKAWKTTVVSWKEVNAKRESVTTAAHARRAMLVFRNACMERAYEPRVVRFSRPDVRNSVIGC
ncbi:hypothetical protein [Myxococcus vastator]|uniref:hypothetical protein n=1 Tax=Myxococcus vastator TaxID=2709664 RepID=UPI0013D15484|nr:hypothetical protein [Myxococcus vastator]